MSHLEDVYRLCIKSLRSGPEGSLPFAKHKILNVIHELISNPHQLAVIAMKEGKVRGVILGMVTPHAYAEGLIAEDIALYVAPCLRGTDCYKNLAQTYDNWCARVPNLLGCSLGLSQLNATTQVMEKLYRDMGYKKTSITYVKLRDKE